MDKLLIFILILLILLISINLSFSSSYNIIEGNTGSSALETARNELKASFPSKVKYQETDDITIQQYIRDIKFMYENDETFRGKVEAYIRELTISNSSVYHG